MKPFRAVSMCPSMEPWRQPYLPWSKETAQSSSTRSKASQLPHNLHFTWPLFPQVLKLPKAGRQPIEDRTAMLRTPRGRSKTIDFQARSMSPRWINPSTLPWNYTKKESLSNIFPTRVSILELSFLLPQHYTNLPSRAHYGTQMTRQNYPRLQIIYQLQPAPPPDWIPFWISLSGIDVLGCVVGILRSGLVVQWQGNYKLLRRKIIE